MGRASRTKPARMSEKLLQIRVALGFSQNEMLKRLELEENLFRSAISGYELGTREPSLLVLLKYARLARVCLDFIVDDELDLPENLPIKPKHHNQTVEK